MKLNILDLSEIMLKFIDVQYTLHYIKVEGRYLENIQKQFVNNHFINLHPK